MGAEIRLHCPGLTQGMAEVAPVFAVDPALRKIICTTHAIESPNRAIRKSIKTRGAVPTDEAATKRVSLAIRNVEQDGRNARERSAARTQFAIMLRKRFDA